MPLLEIEVTYELAEKLEKLARENLLSVEDVTKYLVSNCILCKESTEQMELEKKPRILGLDRSVFIDLLGALGTTLVGLTAQMHEHSKTVDSEEG